MFKEAKAKAKGVVRKAKNVVIGIGVTAATLGGSAMAEDVTIPANPLDVNALAGGAFTALGDAITAIFPYIIGTCILFFTIRYLVRLAKGRS
jgi:hypothetical protein